MSTPSKTRRFAALLIWLSLSIFAVILIALPAAGLVGMESAGGGMVGIGLLILVIAPVLSYYFGGRIRIAEEIRSGKSPLARWTYSSEAARKEKPAGNATTIISVDGILIGETLHTWRLGTGKLEKVETSSEEDKQFLNFTYSMHARYARQYETVRVPVPQGKAAEADRIVAFFNGDAEAERRFRSAAREMGMAWETKRRKLPFAMRWIFMPLAAVLLCYAAYLTIAWYSDSAGADPTFRPGTEDAWRMEISPDGSLVAFAALPVKGISDNSIHIHRSSDGSELPALNTSGGEVLTMSFSPDNRKLALAGTEGISIYDSRSGALSRAIKIDALVKAGDIASIKSLKDLADIEIMMPPRNLVFSGDGEYLAGYGAGIQMWRVSTGERLCKLTIRRGRTIGSVAFTSGGDLLLAEFGSDTFGVRNVTPVDTGFLWSKSISEIGAGEGGGGISALHFAQNASVLVLLSGSQIRVLDVGSGAVLGKSTIKDGESFSGPTALFSGYLLCSPSPKQLRVYEVKTGRKIIDATGDEMVQGAVSHDGALCAVEDKGDIRVYELPGGAERAVFRHRNGLLPNDRLVRDLRFTPDGKRLISLGRYARVWRLDANSEQS